MFEINVSKHGRHYFATHARSIADRNTCKILFEEFMSKFPAKDGYCVTVSKRQHHSVSMTDELIFQMVLDTITKLQSQKQEPNVWKQKNNSRG